MSGFKKKRADGKHYQWDHIRKYHNAICKCAENVGQQLPLNYKSEIKAHLALLKKENTSARSKGQLDQKDADPIDFELYKHICEWSIKDRDVFSWAFTVTQWNLMGRSVNVDPLGFHNMSRKGGSDSVVMQYDSNKKDKTGENTSPKNCYANPYQPIVCFFLALGCYLCLFQDKFQRGTDMIFRRSGKKGSASDTYTKALKKSTRLNDDRKRIVRQHCRPDHFHPYGTRKGSATHVATGTINSPPMPSILLRGEWSLEGRYLISTGNGHTKDYYLVGRVPCWT